MGIKSALAFLFRIFARIAFFAFLFTLPVTIFPIVFGIGGGIIFHVWNHRQVEEHTNALTYEVERKNNLDYWNVPGALTIHDFLDQNGPFHIPTLKTFDWAERLGLILPNEHQFDDTAGIDKIASLEGLVRKATPDCSGYPTRYWVYVTTLPEWRADPWDDAFSSLLQHLYATPLPSDTGIFYLDCSIAGFLCGVWGVKYPSLVYFEVENESLADRQASWDRRDGDSADDPDWLEGIFTPKYTYNQPEHDLIPVTARIMELPLNGDDASNILPRSVLPTPSLQLRTLILDLVPEDIHALWENYSPVVQMICRFQDYIEDLCERRGTLWYSLSEAGKWYSDHVLEPIFGENFTGRSGSMAEIQDVIFTVTSLLAELVRLPFRLAWYVYAWYFGLAWDGLPRGTHVISDDWANEGGSGGNIWDDMMAGFWESIASNLSVKESEKAGRATVTEEVNL